MPPLLQALGVWSLLSSGVQNIPLDLGAIQVDTDEFGTPRKAERAAAGRTTGAEWRARFVFDRDNLSMVDGTEVTILNVMDLANVLACVDLTYDSQTGPGVRACIISDSTGLGEALPGSGGQPVIVDQLFPGQNSLELHNVAATAEGRRDGWAEMWVNDIRVAVLTNIDNFTTATLDRVQAGFLALADSGNTGDLYIGGLVLTVDDVQIGSTIENLVGPGPWWSRFER